jgi:hypothetical protein
MNVGAPGDRAGQTAALRGTLAALARISAPGGVVDLPIAFDESAVMADIRPPQPPPIAKYLMRHPWALPRLLRRDPPEPSQPIDA